MPTIQANGINIEYECHGDGEPLLLIAGVFTHTPTFAPHKTTFGACKTVKLRKVFR